MGNEKVKIDKVILIGPDPRASGGIETVIRNILDLSTDSLKFTNLVSWRPNSFFGIFPFLQTFSSIIRTRKTRKSTVLHLHFGHGGSYVRETILLWIGHIFRFRLMATMHGHNFSQSNSLFRRCCFRLFVFMPCKKIFVLSPAALEFVKKCGRDAILTANPLSQSRNFVGIESRKEIIFYAGRIEKRKGIDLLFESWPRILLDFPNVKLCLAGPVGDFSLFLVKELKNVEYLGILNSPQIADFASNSLAVILPSRNEQSPLILWEAMSSGTNIVATKVGGIPWMLGYDYPFLMNSIDGESLYQALKSLLLNYENLDLEGIKLYEKSKKASPEVFRSEYLSIIETL